MILVNIYIRGKNTINAIDSIDVSWKKNELQELFNMVTQMKSKVAEIDPDTERSFVTHRGLDNIFLTYRQLFSELRKKNSKTNNRFF
jgi:transposase-like protein